MAPTPCARLFLRASPQGSSGMENCGSQPRRRHRLLGLALRIFQFTSELHCMWLSTLVILLPPPNHLWWWEAPPTLPKTLTVLLWKQDPHGLRSGG